MYSLYRYIDPGTSFVWVMKTCNFVYIWKMPWPDVALEFTTFHYRISRILTIDLDQRKEHCNNRSTHTWIMPVRTELLLLSRPNLTGQQQVQCNTVCGVGCNLMFIVHQPTLIVSRIVYTTSLDWFAFWTNVVWISKAFR